MNTLVVITALLSTACGSDSEMNGGGAEAAKSSAMLVEDSSQMPECEKSNERQLVYDQSSSKFLACKSGAWTEVVVKGEKGEKGEAGSKGETGVAGKDGNDNRVVEAIYCSRSLTTPNVIISYRTTKLSSGDLFVMFGIADGNAQIATSLYYSKDQVGALKGAITLQDDFHGTANFGWWSAELDRTGAMLGSVTYNDNELPGGTSLVFSLTSAVCAKDTY